MRELIVIEEKDHKMSPDCEILDEKGNVIQTYTLPIGGHISVNNNEKIKAGDVLVKIPRSVGGMGDITGGLPRVTELFEARNPSNPAIVSEIDGRITLGGIKRGNREIIVQSVVKPADPDVAVKEGKTLTNEGYIIVEEKRYLIPTGRQVLVQNEDFVRAGTPLSDGEITPADILAIMGPTAVQEYIVNEIQNVYRLQGVKINDKHFEVIVRQMMRKVRIVDPGDTNFLPEDMVDKIDFIGENDRIWGKKVVVDAGESEVMKVGMKI